MAKNREKFDLKLGKKNVNTFLKACEDNNVTRQQLQAMAHLISSKVGGKMEQCLEGMLKTEYKGRLAAYQMLEYWLQDDKDGTGMNVQRLEELLLSEDVDANVDLDVSAVQGVPGTSKAMAARGSSSGQEPTILDLLLASAKPLLEAFQKGDADASHLMKICQKMGLGGQFNSQSLSIVNQDMETKMEEVIKKWYQRNGDDATVEKLSQILRSKEVGLTAYARKGEASINVTGESSASTTKTVDYEDPGTVQLREHRDERATSPHITNIMNQTNITNQTNTMNQTNNSINILASLDPHLSQQIEPGQKQFLEKLYKEQCLTTLDGFPGTATSIIKFETIMKSVCMIEGGSRATGFIGNIPNYGVAFMTAGHCFHDKTAPSNVKRLPVKIDFNDYLLHFGNSAGNPLKKETCKLGDLGPFRGSIRYKGERRSFPGNTASNALQSEDYCLLLFHEKKLSKYNLTYLECGEGNYLKNTPDVLVSIFGHPGSSCREGPKKDLRPLRVSWGKEKTADPNGNFLLFDYDSLPGNSGSPVIGRGDANGNGYKVKGIHVVGINNGSAQTNKNGAQSLLYLNTWIPPKNQQDIGFGIIQYIMIAIVIGLIGIVTGKILDVF